MKDLIKWVASYNLGIVEIDDQHQKLIVIINKLYKTMQESTEKKEMKIIIKELSDYADYHFVTEEKYFKQFNYIDSIEHTKSHEMYRETISKFAEIYTQDNNNNEIILPMEMISFLGEWWTGHILGSDRKYVECFHQHGLK